MKPRPHALRTLRTNEQSPDADVCSFVRRDAAPTAKAPTRAFVRSFAESLPRRERLFVRREPAPTNNPKAPTLSTPSANGYAEASLNAASNQVVQYSSPGRSTSVPHEHFDGDEPPSCWT